MSERLIPDPAIPVFGNGQIVRQRQLNAVSAHIRHLFNGRVGGFRTIKPMLVVQGSGTITTGEVDTFQSFTTALVNTDAMWDPGAPSTITIRTPGLYLLEYCVPFVAPGTVSGTAPYIAATIFANGREREIDILAKMRTRLSVGQASQAFVGAVAPLDVGAPVSFAALQQGTTAPASLAIDTAAGGARGSLEWLAPLDVLPGAVSA